MPTSRPISALRRPALALVFALWGSTGASGCAAEGEIDDAASAPAAPATAACAGGIHFAIDLPATLPASADGDALRLRACVDDDCADDALGGATVMASSASTVRVGLSLTLERSACGAETHRVALSLYHPARASGPLFSEARRVYISCPSDGCALPEVAFSVPAAAFKGR